jgi:hypothetical protein
LPIALLIGMLAAIGARLIGRRRRRDLTPD